MNVRVNALRFVGCAIAISAFLFASGSSNSGCGSASSGAGSDAGDSGTGGNTFHVDISLTSGLITFPNKYSGWAVGGGSATNFVAYPSGWSVGGGSATNFIAVPAGWSVGGGSATNFVAYAPGWSVGGGSATNYVAVPAGWTVGGGSATNYTALPPGWSAADPVSASRRGAVNVDRRARRGSRLEPEPIRSRRPGIRHDRSPPDGRGMFETGG